MWGLGCLSLSSGRAGAQEPTKPVAGLPQGASQRSYRATAPPAARLSPDRRHLFTEDRPSLPPSMGPGSATHI